MKCPNCGIGPLKKITSRDSVLFGNFSCSNCHGVFSGKTSKPVKLPSKERGCVGKMKLGRRFKRDADRIAKKHGKKYGVYKCPYCHGHHLTTKLQNSGKYEKLVYVTTDK